DRRILPPPGPSGPANAGPACGKERKNPRKFLYIKMVSAFLPSNQRRVQSGPGPGRRLARMALASPLVRDGRLRASINLGNPILAGRDAAGEPAGVSIDLARELARRLGVQAELVLSDRAAASVAKVTHDEADVGFFAIDPARGAEIAFTWPYVLIEGSYLVGESSTLTDNAQVDGKGCRISVGAGSAYDLFLTRE